MRYFIIMLFIQASCTSHSTHESQIERMHETALKLYDNKDYRRARPYFDSLIKLDSTKGEYFFKRARCFANEMQKERSIKDNLKTIELNYRKDAAYFNLGLDYLFSNETLARYYFRKCLEENPQHPKAGILIEQLNRRSPKLLVPDTIINR